MSDMESVNISNEKTICIIGTGGFAREVFCYVIDVLKTKYQDIDYSKICFLDKDELCNGEKIMGVNVIPESSFDPEKYVVLVGIGDPKIRKKVVEKMPKNTVYATLIHPNAIVSDWVEIGEGSIITPGVIITCNIKMGKQTQLNLFTTIGHDCELGDYFTTAPSVNISGNCIFDECVYFGTNSAVRQGVSICNNVTIGMGGVVVKNINEPGVYIGNPLKKLDK